MVFVKIVTYSPYGDERTYYDIYADETSTQEIREIANDYLAEDIVYFWSISSASFDYDDNFDEFQHDCGFWVDYKDEDSYREEISLIE